MRNLSCQPERNKRFFFFFSSDGDFIDGYRDTRFSPMIFDTFRNEIVDYLRPVDVILWFFFVISPSNCLVFSSMKLISEISEDEFTKIRIIRERLKIVEEYGSWNMGRWISRIGSVTEYQSAGTLINNSSRNWNFFGQFRFVWPIRKHGAVFSSDNWNWSK